MTDKTSPNIKLDSGPVESQPSDSSKKKSLIIRVIVILGLVYFGVTEFILKEPEAPPAPKTVAKPRNRPKKMPIKTEEAKVADAAKVEEIKVPDVKLDIIKKEDTLVTPVENINISKKQEEVAVIQPSEDLPPIAGKDIDKKIDLLIEKENKPEKVQVKKYEPIKEEVSDLKKPEVNLLDKIVQDEKYVDPPTLEFAGRGLVYNCKEKFWACTNKTSYVQCNKNMKWNSANGKPIECATINIYTTNDDCTIVQKYNISTNQPTAFCKQ
jgi:hypothetical protein